MAEGGVIPGGRQSARGGLLELQGEFHMRPRVCSTCLRKSPFFRSRKFEARPPTGRGVAEGKNLRPRVDVLALQQTFLYYT